MIVVIMYINSFKDYSLCFEMTKGLKQTAKKGEPILKEERVLVVDDFEKWLKVAENNLRYYGCEDIIKSTNPLDANKKYSEVNPTIAMIDINFNPDDLEDTQGLDLIGHLREQEYLKDGKIKKVLVAMSSLKEDIKLRALDSGANYFIDKERFAEDFDGFVDWYVKMNIP